MTRLLKANQKCEIMNREGKRSAAFDRGSIMEGPPVNRFNREIRIVPQIDETVWKASEQVLLPLPNDLTRLIYLASIRDYNSGTYRHPHISREYNASTAHEAFELWHEEVFSRLLTNSVSDYVKQLEGYLRYSRADRAQFISTWKSLQAYKAAIPLHVPQRACQTFFLNVSTALAILERALLGTPSAG